mmetsp:Transcript_22223/g.40039  ORF Transcript_22223/g.40039 Transcript_22223/m.40039 type:complete len:369 (+) Transcript_22223:59-1165(+)
MLRILQVLPVAWACSYFEIPVPSKLGESYLIGRTMELSNLLGHTNYSIEVVAAVAGVKYGYVAPTNMFGLGPIQLKIPFEGMNEKGLTVSALLFSESVFQAAGITGKSDVSSLDLVAKLLENCDSVDSALSFLQSVSVVQPQNPLLHGITPGLHWAITDTTGRSVVVEYLNGQPVVSENNPRVMTNDPDIRWHWRNLNTYVNLNPGWPDQNSFLGVETDEAVGTVPRAVGHGWNLFGLPGDFSPPSRFVRLFYLRGYALQHAALKGLEDAIVLGTALLNNVFIPLGSVAKNPHQPGFDQAEYTPYAVLKSPHDRVMMIRGYRNTQWRKIDLTRLTFSQDQALPLEDGNLGIQDITDAVNFEAKKNIRV